jgi:U32 family peptidase
MIELLAPAGDKEKLKFAFKYGADACYFAGKKFGLRAFSANFNDDELKEYVEYAHKLGKKCYITVNIVAHNKDFEGLADYIRYLYSINVDAVIVSDLGIIKLIRDVCPNLPIHVSTQANITNKYAAKFMQEMGVSRLILARELSIQEVKEIKDFVGDLTIECFIHGAMCISYSGRCLLSNYFTGRDSNGGACVQACRWEYEINEVSRKNEKYPIQEDERGTYILNSKDLNMIQHLNDLINAGVSSLKIEGRMKSPYYVATVVNAYRRALNFLEKNPNGKIPQEIVDELFKTSHRKFTTGFYYGSDDKEELSSSMPVQTSEFMAVVLGKDEKTNRYIVEQRNRFLAGDTLNILSPSNSFNKNFVVEHIYDKDGVIVDDAKNVQDKYFIECPFELKEYDILRKDTDEEKA